MSWVYNFLKKIDLLIFIPALLLSSFGLLMIYSFSSESDISVFYRQVSSLTISVFLFLLLFRSNFKITIQITPLIYIFVSFLLLLTLFFGNEVGGSVRWIDLGILRVQASEIAKPTLALALAAFFSSRPPGGIKNIILSVLVVLVPVVLVIQQPDLGNSAILLLIWGFLIFLAGVNLIYMFLGFLGSVLTFPLLWDYLKDYQRVRILSFLNPQLDPQGASYNIVQALIAFGSGQVFGRGLGRGTQSHLDFLPAESTDFIFAFIGEELGFLGILIVVVIFGVLIYRLIRISVLIKNFEGSLFSFAAAFIILIQFFISAGVNMGLLPVTGITLPFVSFGGSSLVSMFVTLGLVNSIVNTYSKPRSDIVFDG